MSVTLHVSDLHICHKGIPKYRPFFSAKHHHLYMLTALFLSAGFRTTLINHGDSCFGRDYDAELKNIYSIFMKIYEIGGNHCCEQMSLRDKYFFDMENVEMQSFFKKYNAWQSHAPIHPEELRDRLNFHGHVHDDTIEHPMYVNCSMESEKMGYWPRSHAELVNMSSVPGYPTNIAANKHTTSRVKKFAIHLERIRSHPLARLTYEYTLVAARDPQYEQQLLELIRSPRDRFIRAQKTIHSLMEQHKARGQDLVFNMYQDLYELADLLVNPPKIEDIV